MYQIRTKYAWGCVLLGNLFEIETKWGFDTDEKTCRFQAYQLFFPTFGKRFWPGTTCVCAKQSTECSEEVHGNSKDDRIVTEYLLGKMTCLLTLFKGSFAVEWLIVPTLKHSASRRIPFVLLASLVLLKTCPHLSQCESTLTSHLTKVWD